MFSDRLVEEMHDAVAILIATHSQGSVMPTHLLDRLILDNHIRAPGGSPPPPSQIQGGPGRRCKWGDPSQAAQDMLSGAVRDPPGPVEVSEKQVAGQAVYSGWYLVGVH